MSERMPPAVTCTRCKRECYDHRSGGGERVCVLCTADEMHAARALHAEDVATLHEVESVCVQCGYDAEAGETLAEWLHRRLNAARRGTTHAG